MKQKKQTYSIKDCVNLLIINSKQLSSSYEEQKAALPDFARWNLPNDIASDWDWKFFENCSDLGQETGDLIKNICDNFFSTSFVQPSYNENIWTHEAMQNHPFWAEQRRLAKELLTLLEKIEATP